MKRPCIVPQSSVESIRWPALPAPPAAATLAVLFQLEQSQWWPPETILEQQRQQLAILLRYCRRHVPFYRDRLRHLGLERRRPLSWEQWRQLPLLTRDDLQQAGEALTGTALPAQHGKAGEVWTSGSTGKPVRVLSTELTGFFWRVFTFREHLWHRRNLQAKLAAIRFVEDDRAQPPHGLKLRGWGPSTDTVLATGPCVLLDIRTGIAEQAEWLVREQPDYILTHPTNLLALARHFEHSSEKLANLQEFRTLSETLTAEIRATCRAAFGVRATDMYSTREVGYIALQCPLHEHYHIQAENVLVEILNDRDEPCGPGEIGRVVVTPLHNFATPLLRYDIGDYAEAGEPCPCGRGLPVINKIMGRVRNMLVLPSGAQSWPVLNYKAYRAAAPIRQAQMIQHSLNRIEARFVTARPLLPQEEEELKKAVQDTLGHPFEVQLTYLDEIPRNRGGKYEEFISHVTADQATRR